jgi:peptide/nickel transport system substrate-binding protein
MKDTTFATVHPAAAMFANEVRTGQMGRREFLARATALGVSSVAAYGLLGMDAPVLAQDTPAMGGTVRMAMETKALKDPRTYDWSELANFSRGWLEYLVEYNNDGSLRGMLLEGWSVNDTATEFTLNVRKGVMWSNGEELTAEHVAFNVARWCDGNVEGNSMAGRMASLVNPDTKTARDGAITVVDSHTVKLTIPTPDITVIVGMADYPAAIVHPSYDGGDPSVNPVGTGPYMPESNEVGIKQVLVKSANAWWGTAIYGGPYLDRIEYIDFGTDPAATVAAAGSGEIDACHQSTGEFIDQLAGLGWTTSEAVTSATLVMRFNQTQEPYTNRDVRRALIKAVNNAVVLELGYSNRGTVAENHHVCPIHPEYAQLPPLVIDPAAAKAELEAAGHGATEFELISLDDAWQAGSCDAAAAQIRDAGINIKRTVLPGSTFWNDWTKYPFSATEWNMRPLGVQVLALAYRSGEAWNEAGMANADFDAALAEALSIADAEKRRAVMEKIEKIMQDEGVMIQAYWRSVYRNFDPKVKGADMHATFEHHHYKWSVAA